MSRTLICVVLVAMLFAMGTAYSQEGLEQEPWYKCISISGYFQARYSTYDGRMDDSFEFRRMYVTLRSKVNDDTTGIITLSRIGPNDPNIDLYNAFVDYSITPEYSVQVGQVPTWFGLEDWEGSSVRLPFERSEIMAGSPATAHPGFYYAGASDRGVWLRRNPQNPSQPLVVVGVCNGQFRANDMNTAKNISVDVKFKRDWGMFGASWLEGTLSRMVGAPAVEVEQDRSAVSAYVRLFPEPFGFQAEWADGELFGNDIDGYYAMGLYKTNSGTAFLQYQDYNSAAQGVAAAAKSADVEYDALSIGYAWDVDAANRITVQYTDGETTFLGGDSQDENYAGAQWQYSFR